MLKGPDPSYSPYFRVGKVGMSSDHFNILALDVKPKMHHVPVLDDILLAFQAHLACFLGALLAFAGDEVVIADDLGADKAFFEIGMDDSSGLRCSIPF